MKLKNRVIVKKSGRVHVRQETRLTWDEHDNYSVWVRYPSVDNLWHLVYATADYDMALNVYTMFTDDYE